MKFFKKLKSSNFWVSMISAVILILQAVFNVDIKTEYLNQIILGILGVLVMTGIVSDTPNNEVTVKQDFDFEAFKTSITSMFTQIGATFQTDITKVMSQLTNATQNNSSKQDVEEVVTKSNSLVKNETIEQSENTQPVAEQLALNMQESGVPVQSQEVVTNQVQQEVIQDTVAPKNEL